MAQVKVVFYLPLQDNDGRDLKPEITAAETELYSLFGTWSNVGFVKGAWRMADGSLSLDDSQAYSLMLEEARFPELKQVLVNFKNKTSQEAIYYEIHRNVEVGFA